MGRFGFNFEWGYRSPLSLEIDNKGGYFYELWNNVTGKSRRFKDDRERVCAVLGNPAALRVWKINCDLGSMGKINRFENDIEVEKDFLYTQKKRPNFYQTWTQFIWDYFFWVQMGTAYMYRTNNIFNDSTQLYWLNPANIDWGSNGKKKYSKFIFSKQSYNDQQREKVKYTWPDGAKTEIPLKDITPFFDLSNGISGNFYVGESDLDSLFKVIRNSERALDAKGTNLKMSEQFFVTGKTDLSDTTQMMMGKEEKESIEKQVSGNKKVHATKSQVDIKRFVENIANLKLDDAFYNDYFTIGAMKGIPRDILEINLSKGSTYENQEKATGRHIEYAIKPKGQMLTDELEDIFGWQDLRFSFSHMMFNQVFEKDKAERQAIQLANLQAAALNGMDASEVKRQTELIMSM